MRNLVLHLAMPGLGAEAVWQALRDAAPAGSVAVLPDDLLARVAALPPAQKTTGDAAAPRHALRQAVTAEGGPLVMPGAGLAGLPRPALARLARQLVRLGAPLQVVVHLLPPDLAAVGQMGAALLDGVAVPLPAPPGYRAWLEPLLAGFAGVPVTLVDAGDPAGLQGGSLMADLCARAGLDPAPLPEGAGAMSAGAFRLIAALNRLCPEAPPGPRTALATTLAATVPGHPPVLAPRLAQLAWDAADLAWLDSQGGPGAAFAARSPVPEEPSGTRAGTRAATQAGEPLADPAPAVMAQLALRPADAGLLAAAQIQIAQGQAAQDTPPAPETAPDSLPDPGDPGVWAALLARFRPGPTPRSPRAGTRPERPYLILTLRRTGGTSLMSFLAQVSAFDGVQHEPFNPDRIWGPLVADYLASGDAVALRAAIAAELESRPNIKHCFEVVPTEVTLALIEECRDRDYGFLVLTRRDEASRLRSLFLAQATGAWGSGDARRIYPEILSGARKVAPIPVETVQRQTLADAASFGRTMLLLRNRRIPHDWVLFEELYQDDGGIRDRARAIATGFGIPVGPNDKRLNAFARQSGQGSGAIEGAVPGFAEVRALLDRICRP